MANWTALRSRLSVRTADPPINPRPRTRGPRERRGRSEPRNVSVLILAAACWGVGTVVSKQAVAEMPPLTLLPIQLARQRRVPAGRHARFAASALPGGREGRLLGRLGLLNPGLAYALSLIGLTQITASLVRPALGERADPHPRRLPRSSSASASGWRSSRRPSSRSPGSSSSSSTRRPPARCSGSR